MSGPRFQSVPVLAISFWPFRGLAAKDGGTFEDMEFFS